MDKDRQTDRRTTGRRKRKKNSEIKASKKLKDYKTKPKITKYDKEENKKVIKKQQKQR